MISKGVTALAALMLLGACATGPEPRGTGDLGVVIERATGSVKLVEHSHDTVLGEVGGFGDLSHAAIVFSRDERFAYVFGRDGGLTKLDILTRKTAGRVVQAGNSIGGAISEDGRLDGVCVGTNYANDYTYYYHRPAMDDVHGYGPVLLCGAEMLRLVKNDKLEITGSPTRPVMVLPKSDKKESSK